MSTDTLTGVPLATGLPLLSRTRTLTIRSLRPSAAPTPPPAMLIKPEKVALVLVVIPVRSVGAVGDVGSLVLQANEKATRAMRPTSNITVGRNRPTRNARLMASSAPSVGEVSEVETNRRLGLHGIAGDRVSEEADRGGRLNIDKAGVGLESRQNQMR